MQKRTYDLVYISIFSVLLAICSWISIPTLVPFTLQTFGVFLTLLILGGKRGTFSILLYLLLGSIGIPVFSNFGAGLGYLLGNTGGYVLGFLFTGLTYRIFELLFPAQKRLQIPALLIGLILCYGFGSLWFLLISTSGRSSFDLTYVLGICVFPFILPDLCKLGLAWVVSKRLKKSLHLYRM